MRYMYLFLTILCINTLTYSSQKKVRFADQPVLCDEEYAKQALEALKQAKTDPKYREKIIASAKKQAFQKGSTPQAQRVLAKYPFLKATIKADFKKSEIYPKP